MCVAEKVLECFCSFTNFVWERIWIRNSVSSKTIPLSEFCISPLHETEFGNKRRKEERNLKDNLLYRYFGLFMFFFCLCATTLAQELPVPQKYVEDNANIMSDPVEQKLNGYLQELEQKTGAQMIVLTINTTGDIPIDTYAIELATRWKLGQKGKNNGVLVVIAKNDRAYRVEVGYGLEGILPDSYCGTIGETYFVPYFQKGKFDEGIFQAVVEMAHKIAENNGVKITGMLDQSSKEEAIRAQQKKEKEDVRKRLDEFLKKNGVETWPSMNELSGNPFIYEGKTIALMASFSTMETATQGIFNNSREPFIVTDIPKGTFKKSGTIVVLAGKVLGKTELQNHLLGLMQVPHLKFVGVHFCKDGNCSDIISE